MHGIVLPTVIWTLTYESLVKKVVHRHNRIPLIGEILVCVKLTKISQQVFQISVAKEG